MTLKSRDFLGDGEALKWALKDVEELEQVLRLLPEQRVAVQAGGNLGVYPRWLARHFADVYTFEPAPDLFELLVRNVPEDNVVKLQAALGDAPHTTNVARTRRNDPERPAHAGLTHVKGIGRLPVIKLDSLGLQHCDLLCLDVEGYELFALRGADETLARCKPVIVLELNDRWLAEYGHRVTMVASFLMSRGYVHHSNLRSDSVWVPLKS